jgi:hypothetical protein
MLGGVVVLPPSANAQKSAPAANEPTSSTARGLDLWVHADREAPGGENLSLSIVALGFPTATTVVPLQNALVEATWDPESLSSKDDERPASVPAPVRANSASDGGVTLVLPVPPGPPRELKLLLRVQANGRDRTVEYSIQRTARSDIDLFVSDSAVVPGSEVMAWAIFSGKDGKRPNTDVEFVLSQGEVVRERVETKTDLSGTASAKLRIPRDSGPAPSFVLEARTRDSATRTGKSTTLTTREELPGQPTFRATFDETWAVAGDKARYRVRVRDATGEPIRGQSVLIWNGPRGTEPPVADLDFEKVAEKQVTDVNGEVTATVNTPSTVPLRGSQHRLEVRTELEGRALQSSAEIEIGQQRGFVRMTPENDELIPGLRQRVVLEMSRDGGKPIVGTFVAKGDNLSATFTTNSHGEAELEWDVPVGAGAFRKVGPCPNQVAAQLTLKAVQPESGTSEAFGGALVGADGMSLCIPVQREAKFLVRPAKLVVQAGESLPLSVIGAPGKFVSVLCESINEGTSTASQLRLDQGTQVVTIPENAQGPMDLLVAAPQLTGSTLTSRTRILVLPKRLPTLNGTIASGKAAPGSFVTIDAVLKDSKGLPLVGTVAAVVVDKHGGANLDPLLELDTKGALCSTFGVEPSRCDAVLSGGAEHDPLRRARLRPTGDGTPLADPAGTAGPKFDSTFQQVVRSLEGAVFESSMAVETLPDVYRKEKGRFVFNPELMTLVTDAIDQKPLTPGGETVTLADLIAKDSQINFDNVARRVTRLKMFNVLDAMRSERTFLNPDEPILDEPNALLRKIVRRGSLLEGNLLDPWGGTLTFHKTNEEYVPFISFKRGFSLSSPGPDGKLGTPDDVSSPFARVLKSGTPYARASHEDELVDSRFDMLVADETVSNWKDTLNRATGTALGGGFAAEHGSGTGTGSGFGNGSGRLAGSHRVRRGGTSGITFMSEPVQTDENGRARIQVQLGTEETTWQIALIGLPNEAGAAVSTLEVPVNLELSSKVFAGARMTTGDVVSARVHLRNRTDKDTLATLSVTAEGALALAPNFKATPTLIPAKGAVSVSIPVRAVGAGEGSLNVVTSAPGLPSDTAQHTVTVEPAGTAMNIARTAWVSENRELAEFLDKSPFQRAGAATLTLFNGPASQLERMVTALEDTSSSSADELADIADTSARLERYLRSRSDAENPLADRLKIVTKAARARVSQDLRRDDALSYSLRGRLDNVAANGKGFCPPENLPLVGAALATALDAEPTPKEGVVLACFTELAARGVKELSNEGKPDEIARGIVALATRPHRAAELGALRDTLLAKVRPAADGRIDYPGASRASRALVHAAMILSATESTPKREKDRHLAWLLVQRDSRGSFGSAAATRAALLAMLDIGVEDELASATVEVDFGEAGTKSVLVKPGQSISLLIPDTADALTVSTDQPILTEVSRNYLRPFSVAPSDADGNVRMSVRFPSAPMCPPEKPCAKTLTQGDVGNLVVTLLVKEAIAAQTRVHATIPLPPGVVLAEPQEGIRQVQGSLHIDRSVGATEQVLAIPLRFNLAGTFVAREAEVRALDEQQSPSITRSRTIVVSER